jgi:hypothetical protein
MTDARIYWGTLGGGLGPSLVGPVSYSLQDFPAMEFPGHFSPVWVDFDFHSEDEIRLVNQLVGSQVSILGIPEEPTNPVYGTVPSILAEKIVRHSDIAVRAFEIYASGRGGSAFENWLEAESELLGAPKRE